MRYLCKSFPFRTTQSHLLPGDGKIRQKSRPEISKDRVCEEEQVAKPYQKVSIHQVVFLAIQSDATVRISGVEREGLKPHKGD